MGTDRRWLAPVILALALSAEGVHPRDAAAQSRPCRQDVEKFCPTVKPGSPEARQCLRDNLDKLSEACRQRISSRNQRQGYPSRFKGCESDLDKHCKDLRPGGGRLIKCLRDHEADLSVECKDRIGGAKGGAGARGGGGGGGGGGGRDGRMSSTPPAGVTAAPQPTVQAK